MHPPLPSASPLSPRGFVFGPRDRQAALRLIREAIAEDAPETDVTSDALFLRGEGLPRVLATADYVPREPGVLCGIPVLRELYLHQAPAARLEELSQDGDALVAGQACLRVTGPMVDILRLERVSLNFLQRLCGVATETRRWADDLAGTGVALLDTRKTIPGWRLLEKYAVRVGGGENHRESLSDAFLLKDNHAEALRALGWGGTADWVRRMRDHAPGLTVEVEVSTREEFLEALEAGADIVLLDNFSLEDIRWAVATRDSSGGSAPLLEASGGIVRSALAEIAATGIERISVGHLTHSARALDLGLDLVRVGEERAQPGDS